MEIESTSEAIIEWLHTFHAGSAVESLEDLCDGLTLAEVLHEMSPEHFDPDSLNKDVNGNWALAAANLRNVLRQIQSFYNSVLYKEVDTEDIDVSDIAKTHSPSQLILLTELCVGVAVHCERKNELVQQIFSLSELSQSVLKEIVTLSLQRLRETEGESVLCDESVSVSEGERERERENAVEEELIRKNEMIAHLQSERQSLLDELQALTQSHNALSQEMHALKTQSLSLSSHTESDAHRLQDLENRNVALQRGLDDARRDLDICERERERLGLENTQILRKMEALRETCQRLEMENIAQNDELQIAREFAAKLAKAEATVAKYQERVLELSNVKKECGVLSSQLDDYVTRLQACEDEKRTLTASLRVCEAEKKRVSELERERVEWRSERALLTERCERALSDVKTERERARVSEREAAELRALCAELSQTHIHTQPATHTQTGIGEEVGSLSHTQPPTQTAALTHTHSESESERVAVLRAELERERDNRVSMEDMYMRVKRELETLKETQPSQSAGRDDASLAQLRAQLSEKETEMARIAMERDKAVRYVQEVKTKVGPTISRYNEQMEKMAKEKEEVTQKYTFLQKKLDGREQRWEREKRLMSAALYELGVRSMHHTIQNSLGHTHTHANANAEGFALDGARAALQSVSVGVREDSSPEKRLASSGALGTPLAKY